MESEVFFKAMESLKDWRSHQPYTDMQRNVLFPEAPADPSLQPTLLVGMGDFEKAVVALAAYREMREDLWPGMSAVVQVVRNRARAGWFHGSMYENVVAKNVFPSMTLYGHPDTVRFPDEHDQQFWLFLTMLDGLFNGVVPDNTNGALYYHWYYSEPVFCGCIAYLSQKQTHQTCAKIGKILFWKEVVGDNPQMV